MLKKLGFKTATYTPFDFIKYRVFLGRPLMEFGKVQQFAGAVVKWLQQMQGDNFSAIG